MEGIITFDVYQERTRVTTFNYQSSCSARYLTYMAIIWGSIIKSSLRFHVQWNFLYNERHCTGGEKNARADVREVQDLQAQLQESFSVNTWNTLFSDHEPKMNMLSFLVSEEPNTGKQLNPVCVTI